MLDRLAQIVVDRLRPQLERVIDEHFKELKADLHVELEDAYIAATDKFSSKVANALPRLQNELRAEITQQIIRGVKK